MSVGWRSPESMASKSFETLGSPRNCTLFKGCYHTHSFNGLSTPFVSAPSSPIPYWVLKTESDASSSSSTQLPAVVPFSWEDKPGTPKNGAQTPQSAKRGSLSLTESEFQFSSRFSDLDYRSICTVPADELFVNGQIKPLRPPPRLQQPLISRQQVTDKSGERSYFSSRSFSACPATPTSPLSPLKRIQRSIIKRVFCGICDPTFQEFDPFAAAMEEMARNETCNWHQRSQTSKSFEPENFFLNQLTIDDFLESQGDSKRTSSSKKSKRQSVKNFLYRHGPRGLKHWISRSSLREDQCTTAHKESKVVDEPVFSSGPNMDSPFRVDS
eukprot:c26707_g2_i1 orf=117-1097(-)